MEPFESTIRNHLDAYIAGEATLDQFADWFVGASWDVDRSMSPKAYALAAAIELVLAEGSSGLLTREKLQGELAKLAADVPIGVKILHEAEIR